MDQRQRPTIGVLIDWPNLAEDRLRGMCAAAAQADFSLCLIPLGDRGSNHAEATGRQALRALVASPRFDAFIALSGPLAVGDQGAAIRELLLASRGERPLVSIGPSLMGEPTLTCNQAAGFDELLDHLLGFHHYRKPVYVSGPLRHTDAVLRLERYRAALLRHGFADDPQRFYEGDWSFAGGAAAIQEFLDRRRLDIDVTICANDFMALGAEREFLSRGILVPDDMAVSGYDNVVISAISAPFLATVAQPDYRLGSEAMRLVADLLAGKPAPKGGGLALPSQFLPRATCGCEANHQRIAIPPLVSRLSRLSEDRKRERVKDSIRVFEIMQSLDDHYHDRHVQEMMERWVESFRLDRSPQGHAEREFALTRDMGLENFYLSVFEPSAADLAPPPDELPLRSRLLIAHEAGRALDLPPGGIAYQSLELFPPDRQPVTRQCLCVSPLGSEGSAFGLLLTDYRVGESELIELLVSRLSATYIWIRDSTRLASLNDELAEAKRRLECLSSTDELSGLCNRRGFLSLASREMLMARHQGKVFSVVFIDLDGLKLINDNFGHDEGDIAIKRLGAILLRCFRETDIVARLGGDEFIVYAAGLNASDAAFVRKRFQHELEADNTAQAKPWQLSASMGFFHSEADCALSLEEMMKSADECLYQEKRAKKNSEGAHSISAEWTESASD
jgi:diguanylate cyclase (GGDEF)-like protein